VYRILDNSQLVISEAVLSRCSTRSRWADGKFKVTKVIDGKFNIDSDDLTGSVASLDSRRVLIVVRSVRATILDLTTDAITPEVSLVNIVVQGCSLVVTSKSSVLKSVDIARPTISFVRQQRYV
jgi:hypothetical protein